MLEDKDIITIGLSAFFFVTSIIMSLILHNKSRREAREATIIASTCTLQTLAMLDARIYEMREQELKRALTYLKQVEGQESNDLSEDLRTTQLMKEEKLKHANELDNKATEFIRKMFPNTHRTTQSLFQNGEFKYKTILPEAMIGRDVKVIRSFIERLVPMKIPSHENMPQIKSRQP